MELSPVFLSLRVALTALIVIFALGVPLAHFMARSYFPGKDLLEALFSLPLVLPPSVVGFMLLFLFGKNGPLGSFLAQSFQLQVIFTWWGAVLAAVIVAFPLMYRPVKAAFEGVDNKLEQAARTLGSSELRVFFTITLPLAWPGVVTGLVMAFTRALGEFGATLMIAGNIPGRTQTMPLAIYFAAETGEMRQAAILVALLTIFSFLVVFWSSRWQRERYTKLEGK